MSKLSRAIYSACAISAKSVKSRFCATVAGVLALLAHLARGQHVAAGRPGQVRLNQEMEIAGVGALPFWTTWLNRDAPIFRGGEQEGRSCARCWATRTPSSGSWPMWPNGTFALIAEGSRRQQSLRSRFRRLRQDAAIPNRGAQLSRACFPRYSPALK
jgi:hypothetical protein